MEEVSVFAILSDPSLNSRSNLPRISELAQNVGEIGLLSPIVVRRLNERERWERSGEGPLPSFAVVAGFRRFAAVQSLHWDFIPAVVLDITEEQARLVNLAENIERQDLRLYDLMRSVSSLCASGLKTKKIEKETGVPEQKIYRLSRIWPRLSTNIKERWSRIEDRAWEPPLLLLEKMSRVSWSEQGELWTEWAREESPEEMGEEPKEEEEERKKRRGRRPVREIRGMIEILGKSKEDQAQKRALLWAVGKRRTL